MKQYKTCEQMLNDSCERSKFLDLYVWQVDDITYGIINNSTNGEYFVTIDPTYNSVISCSCPHYVYRLSELQLPCKHMMAIAYSYGFNY